jgi:hypothetical protein
MPFNLPRRDTASSGPRRTYRQPAMLVPGIVLLLTCVGFLVAIVFDGGLTGPGQILWPVAAALVVWVIFLRPCVQLTQAGVVMRNLVRDVRFGWPAIDLIEQRWNLKIFDKRGKGYGSWAITAQRPSRSVARGGLKAGPGLGPINPDHPASVLKPRPGSAASVAFAIRAGQLDYSAAAGRDASYEAADEIVAAPAWPPIVAIVAAAVCVVVAILG